MGSILTLIVFALFVAFVIFVYVCIAKFVYFIKRTKYIYGLRNRLKMQQKGADEATEGEEI